LYNGPTYVVIKQAHGFSEFEGGTAGREVFQQQMPTPNFTNELDIQAGVKGQMQLMTRVLSNQECILIAVQNVDGADNIVKSQQAAAECERNASLCAEGATRVQSAEEVTTAAAPIVEELKAMRAEMAALKTQLAEVKESQCQCIIS